MDENNRYNKQFSDETGDALEQAARQQAVLQEEQAQLREQPVWETQASPVNGQWEAQPQAVQSGGQPSWTPPQPPVYAQPPQDAGQETRTPYQVPVRDSREMHSQAAQAGPAPYQAAGGQWPQPPKKKGRAGRRLAVAAGGVAAAAILFFGGAAVGSMLGDFDTGERTDSGAATQFPTVQSAITIAEAPEGLESVPGDIIYERVNPSVVSITATSLTSNGGALGSGIVMSEDGYIVTNHHVTEEMDKFIVMLSDGSELNASLVAGDADTDVAVLKAETGGRKLTVPEFGDSDALKPGEAAYAIGTPTAYRLTNTITTGSISAINRNITINDKVMTLIQTDAAINSGNSGGALVNKYGQVVGITNAKLSSNFFSSNASYEGLGFAIPMNTAKGIVDELMTNGYVAGRPSIGISGYEISEAVAQYNDVPQGVLIQSVDSRAKAYGQGLEVRDIITGINGTTITTMDEINKVKNQFQAGDTVTLTIYRMSVGKTLDMKVELTDAHDLEGADPAKVRVDQADNSENQRGSGGNGYDNFPFSNFFGW